MNRIAFQTDLGYVALAEQNHSLLALVFGYTSKRSAMRSLATRIQDVELPIDGLGESRSWADDLVDRLREFARGEPTDFSDIVVDAHEATSFQRRVIDACRAIPWGETCSYGELARRVGRPGAARAVGTVMATNRVPLIVPCHRVVAASGRLGGYSAPQGLAMKRRLLAAEQRVPSLL